VEHTGAAVVIKVVVFKPSFKDTYFTALQEALVPHKSGVYCTVVTALLLTMSVKEK